MNILWIYYLDSC